MGLSDEQRKNIVKVAESWLGTPYVGHSAFKGPKGGTDCGQLLKAVYTEAGHAPSDGIPTPVDYSLEVWLHKEDTTYIDIVEKYMRQIPESEVKEGDVVFYKMGRGYAHAAIVVKWPEYVIHALNRGGVCGGHGMNLKYGRLEKKFYTIKDELCGEKK